MSAATRHGATTVQREVQINPLDEPVPHDLVFEGLAATDDIDHSRMKFRRWCFELPVPWRPNPPLLWRHGEPAGEIEEIRLTESGLLWVRARVSHPLAKRCSSFSLGASIQSWEIRDADDPVNFHGLIVRAVLDEVSITDRPCNDHAVVTRKYRVPPFVERHELEQRAVSCLTKMIDLIRHQLSEPPPPPPNAIRCPLPSRRGPRSAHRGRRNSPRWWSS